MANVDEKFGFRLSRKRGKCVEAVQYRKKAGVAIYEGDLLKLDANGEADLFVAGDGKCLGVAAHTSKAASTSPIAVYDDPEAIFEAQASTAVAADGGANADIAAAPTPNTDLGRSGQQVDGATFAATPTLPLKVLELSDRDGNEAGAAAKVYVKLNNCVKGSGDGSTGV